MIKPYIATAGRVTWQKLWQNIIALNKSRLQAFAGQFIIELCFSLIGLMPLLVAYVVDQRNSLTVFVTWTGYVGPVISLPLWFISALLIAIFCAESFRRLGVGDESQQQKPRPEEGALAGV